MKFEIKSKFSCTIIYLLNSVVLLYIFLSLLEISADALSTVLKFYPCFNKSFFFLIKKINLLNFKYCPY